MQEASIQSQEDVARLVNDWGFLPFFAHRIRNFSIEECTPDDLWFSKVQDGPWEWKGPVIVEGDAAYGKFMQQKACYISMDFFPDFMNYRRSKYRITPAERILLRTLQEKHSLLSKELKKLCGYVKPRQIRVGNPLERQMAVDIRKVGKKEKTGKESFDTAITHLQMATYVVIADFEYNYDRQGRRYGWGVARYCTPEDFFGSERLVVARSPMESYRRLYEHLRGLLPAASHEEVTQFLG